MKSQSFVKKLRKNTTIHSENLISTCVFSRRFFLQLKRATAKYALNFELWQIFTSVTFRFNYRFNCDDFFKLWWLWTCVVCMSFYSFFCFVVVSPSVFHLISEKFSAINWYLMIRKIGKTFQLTIALLDCYCCCCCCWRFVHRIPLID